MDRQGKSRSHRRSGPREVATKVVRIAQTHGTGSDDGLAWMRVPANIHETNSSTYKVEHFFYTGLRSDYIMT